MLIIEIAAGCLVFYFGMGVLVVLAEMFTSDKAKGVFVLLGLVLMAAGIAVVIL
jgi:hypothetical protein